MQGDPLFCSMCSRVDPMCISFFLRSGIELSSLFRELPKKPYLEGLQSLCVPAGVGLGSAFCTSQSMYQWVQLLEEFYPQPWFSLELAGAEAFLSLACCSPSTCMHQRILWHSQGALCEPLLCLPPALVLVCVGGCCSPAQSSFGFLGHLQLQHLLVRTVAQSCLACSQLCLSCALVSAVAQQGHSQRSPTRLASSSRC